MESMVAKWYFVTFSSCSVLRRPREQKKEEKEVLTNVRHTYA